jgi:hypothetical protein
VERILWDFPIERIVIGFDCGISDLKIVDDFIGFGFSDRSNRGGDFCRRLGRGRELL